jgi:putative ABC transport system permease protein
MKNKKITESAPHEINDNFVVKSSHTTVSTKKSSIHKRTLFYIAWRNMTSKKLRSFLTISGIAVGIGSIAFLISFGLGLQLLVTKNVIGDKSIKSIEVSSPNSKIIKLDAKAVNKIRLFSHIEKLGVEYSFPASVGLKGGGIDSVIYGIDTTYQSLTSLNLQEGRLLNEKDNKVVLISDSALRSIGITDSKKAIGQKLDVIVPLQYINEKSAELKDSYKIVGVIDSGKNNEIFVPSAVFDVAGVPTYKQLKVAVDDTKNIPTVRKQIESSGFQTSSPIDTLDQINQLFKFFNIVLAGFGAIGIIVAILGMFNTLTISLLERTKEIGLMITLGGRKKDMRRLFMIEAVLLSVIGAVTGIVSALIGSRIINTLINKNAEQRVSENFEVFSTPFWLLVVLTIFMIVVGLAVAYFPARRAQRISPIEALRRE